MILIVHEFSSRASFLSNVINKRERRKEKKEWKEGKDGKLEQIYRPPNLPPPYLRETRKAPPLLARTLP